MKCRVSLGANSGGMGLKVALPGYDVHLDDDQDPTKFAFNSNWANLAKIHSVGIAWPEWWYWDAPTPGPAWYSGFFETSMQRQLITNPTALSSPYMPYARQITHGLGYVPFIEARPYWPPGVLSGITKHQHHTDYKTTNSLWGYHNGIKVHASSSWAIFPMLAYLTGGSTPSENVQTFCHATSYVIYRIPVPM